MGVLVEDEVWVILLFLLLLRFVIFLLAFLFIKLLQNLIKGACGVKFTGTLASSTLLILSVSSRSGRCSAYPLDRGVRGSSSVFGCPSSDERIDDELESLLDLETGKHQAS